MWVWVEYNGVSRRDTPTPPPPPGGGGGGARVVPDALLYNNEKPRCKNSGVIVLLLFTYPL
jgi:hypothetical protein